jgi:predicted nuclease of predicted toxin-antitoxin system
MKRSSPLPSAKTLKFLIDESTGAQVAAALQAAGYDAMYVGQMMPGAKDKAILAQAHAEGRILVTNDKDFGERVYRSREPHAGVILLRLRRDVPRRRIAILRKLIADWGQRLQNNGGYGEQGAHSSKMNSGGDAETAQARRGVRALESRRPRNEPQKTRKSPVPCTLCSPVASVIRTISDESRERNSSNDPTSF